MPSKTTRGEDGPSALSSSSRCRSPRPLISSLEGNRSREYQALTPQVTDVRLAAIQEGHRASVSALCCQAYTLSDGKLASWRVR